MSKSNEGVLAINSIKTKMPWLYSFWNFARPHTVIGTSFSVLGLYLIVWSDRSFPGDNKFAIATSLLSVLLTWIACICGNIYIVGLNQLEDVEIDKINKPKLPLAAGEFSRSSAEIIVATTGILAVLLALLQGPFLLATVGISLLIGTAYSLPPIRLKRFPFWAAMCIFTVRGVIVNLGFFLHLSWVWEKIHHARATLNASIGEIGRTILMPELAKKIPEIPLTVWGLTAFVLVFTFAIAIFKDVPDIEGDRQYNISTLTIRMGAKAVFNLARGVLTVCYLGTIVFGVVARANLNPIFLVVTHLVILGLMWWRSLEVNLEDKGAIASFYQFIWKLFFLEYLIFPIACLL